MRGGSSSWARQEAPRRTSFPLRRRCEHRSDRRATRRSPWRCTGRARCPESGARAPSESGRSAGRAVPAPPRGCRCPCPTPRGRRRRRAASRRTTTLPPAGVNLIAFETRLSRSCASRTDSPSIGGNRLGLRRRASPARSPPAAAPRSTVCATTSPRSTRSCSSSSRPSWSRAVKSRSETRPSRRCALRSTIARWPRFSSSGSDLEQELDVARDRGQRRPQLVRDARDELVLEVVELDELLVLVGQQLLRLLGFASRDPLRAPRAARPRARARRAAAGRGGRAPRRRCRARTRARDGARPARRSASRARPAARPRAGRAASSSAAAASGAPAARCAPSTASSAAPRPHHVRGEPERVDRVTAGVGVVVQAVDLVRDHPQRDAHEQEAIRGGAARRARRGAASAPTRSRTSTAG